MYDLHSELKKDNAALSMQLERLVAENKRLGELLDTSATNGLSNDDLHQFNNVAALLDANIELALNALLNLPSSDQTVESDITTIRNFITAAQSAKTELVDIVNT